MRVEVHGSGFTSAADALCDANQLALLTHQHLTATLAGTGAMAGTDTTAAEFATAYDQAAHHALQTLGALVDALASLGMATNTSLENHLRAEHASNPFGPRTTEEPTYDRHTFYDAPAATVPTCLGGDTSTLPGWANLILDHVGGFLWPDADTTRLRTAATAWSTAATELTNLAPELDLATDALHTERSPETTLAHQALHDLHHDTDQLTTELTNLAEVCDSYADQVDTQRQAVLDLVNDLIRDTLILEAAGGLLDIVTGGLSSAGATELAIAHIADKAPQILHALELLRDLTRGFTTTIRLTTQSLSDLTLRFRRYTHLRMLMRSERGTFRIDLGLGGDPHITWLKKFEDAGGHTLKNHVGLSDTQLMARFEHDPIRALSSTFTDAGAARRAIEFLVREHPGQVRRFLSSDKTQTVLRGPVPGRLGRCLDRDGNSYIPDGARVVLRRHPGLPDGYRVHTAFPDVLGGS